MPSPLLDRPTERSRALISLSSRRDLATICGVLSVGVFAWMIYGMVDVAEIYDSAFVGGWTVLWVLMAAVGSMLGAGAVVLWHPPESSGVTWRAVLGVAVLLTAVSGALFLLGPVF